jgi:glutamine cyclotransferase
VKAPRSARRRAARSKQKSSTPRSRLPALGAAALLGIAVVLVSYGRLARRAPVFTYEIVNEFPHDPTAYTQGLIFRDSTLFESVGRYGRSELRRVALETGEVLQRHAMDSSHFGEGLADWGEELVQLTWQSRIGIVYDLASLNPVRTFQYPGEGWGLARSSDGLIMSDGTSTLRFLDPGTLQEEGRVEVVEGGRPVTGLNELEMMRGDLLANVWQTNHIVVIDPASGRVKGRLDLAGLLKMSDRSDSTDVLNGIAYDAASDRLFVTGKLWPKLFEIRMRRVD